MWSMRFTLNPCWTECRRLLATDRDVPSDVEEDEDEEKACRFPSIQLDLVHR